MAFTASALISTGSIDSFMTIIKNCLTSSGWDLLEINSSSIQPARNLNGREFVFRGKGVGTDPTRFYLNIMNQTDSAGGKRIVILPFTGAKNFDTPVAINQLSASINGGANITASTTTPHNLLVGDLLIIGGNNNPQLNEGWGGSDVNPTTAFRVAQVFTTSSFAYSSVASTGSGNGGFVVSPYNTAPGRATDQNNATTISFTAVTASFTAFMYFDEYRICGCISQSANFQTFYWGETGRAHIPAKYRDRGFLSASIGSGSVTASISRNVNNLRVGQNIWFVHVSGTTNGTGTFERTIITSRPTSASFGCVLANAYPSGSMVGEDPLPVVVIGALGTNPATSTFTARTAKFIFHIDATRDATSPLGGATTYAPTTDTGIAEANIDPDAMNYIQGRYITVNRATNPSGIRGRLVGIVSFANGPQTGSQEIIRVGDSSSLSDYKNFPTNTTDTTYTFSIGPGAS